MSFLVISKLVKIIFYYHSIDIKIINFLNDINFKFPWMVKFYICVMKIMVKWQIIIILSS
jgi:hypothetical protein